MSAVETVSHERANQLASTDVFAHDLDYVSSRLKALGVCYTTFGEIIAWELGYPTYDPARTIQQWWNSTGHHAIMVGDYNGAGGSHKTSTAQQQDLLGHDLREAVLGTTAGRARPSSSACPAAIGTPPPRRSASSRFAGGAQTVFIATGDSFPDALSGSPAAAKANGPILLTAADRLPGCHRHRAGAPQAIEDRHSRRHRRRGRGRREASWLPTRAASRGWSGADRYATAATISRSAFSPGVAVAYISTGSTFPDALSGGAIAGRNGGPILLVEAGSLPNATAAELARLKPAADRHPRRHRRRQQRRRGRAPRIRDLRQRQPPGRCGPLCDIRPGQPRQLRQRRQRCRLRSDGQKLPRRAGRWPGRRTAPGAAPPRRSDAASQRGGQRARAARSVEGHRARWDQLGVRCGGRQHRGPAALIGRCR